MNFIKKHKVDLFLLPVILIIGYFVFIHGNDNENLRDISVYKCPADYSNPEDLNNDKEYRADIDTFIADYTESHPSATQDDLMAERDRLFIENDCINRYYNNPSDYPDWCPLNKQEIDATFEYMRSLETEEVLGIMKLLSKRSCLDALAELNQMMTDEIESGKSPGSQP